MFFEYLVLAVTIAFGTFVGILVAQLVIWKLTMSKKGIERIFKASEDITNEALKRYNIIGLLNEIGD